MLYFGERSRGGKHRATEEGNKAKWKVPTTQQSREHTFTKRKSTGTHRENHEQGQPAAAGKR